MTSIHIVLAVSMLPVLLVFFQQASLVAPLANIVAVPWVNLLVVPVALIGTVLLFINATAGGLLLNLATWLMDTLWPFLAWLGKLDFTLLQQHQPLPWTLLSAMAGILLLFAPRGFPARRPGDIVALSGRGLPQTEAWVTLLDVGQGLSTVIRT
jgi:competence protein ComEC